jgi:mannose-6-phosphate isomerase-like protein (cupin superfamily)
MSARLFALLLVPAWLPAADRAVDPTFLRTSYDQAKPTHGDLCPATNPCDWRPFFEHGGIVRGVARYGVLTLARAERTATVTYPRQEHAFFVWQGAGELTYGEERHPLRAGDFAYLPANLAFAFAHSGDMPARIVLMGFNLPKTVEPRRPPRLAKANIDEVKKQVVGNHPPSTLYQLMMGDWSSTRDRLATGHVLTSLFIMEFAPGGTNFPHHHDREEEIYLLLDGDGEMVAGSGIDGVEGRYPAKPGDAYFIRLNATVGFYNSNKGTSHILAIRSLYPFSR